ncbi:MAG: hypothetical protein E6H48_19070 [Betaproteobacteria bacterium]|nr:MAG: hypothetical protein E6H48_19070 [Betaproteobacteria bacterium]
MVNTEFGTRRQLDPARRRGLHEMQRDPQRGRNQSSDAERHAKTLGAGKQGKIVERHAAQDAKV